jgi:hypothetical protein
MGHFAQLFVFNDLPRFSFRMESQAPSRSHEMASRLPPVLKNSNKRPPVRQEKVDCPAGRAPSLDRRAFAAGGNCPNDPFKRIPYQSSSAAGHALPGARLVPEAAPVLESVMPRIVIL